MRQRVGLAGPARKVGWFARRTVEGRSVASPDRFESHCVIDPRDRFGDRGGVGRVTAADRRRVDEIVDLASRFDPDAPPVLERVMPMVRRLLRADQGMAYRPVLARDGWQLGVFHVDGIGPRLRDDLERTLATAPRRYAWFDPAHPEPWQRNVVVRVADIVPREEFERSPFVKSALAPSSLHRSDQLRALVCDGPVLLAWLGALRDEPFGPRERKLLAEIVAPIRDRLRLEERLRRAEVLEAGLAAALEHVPAAAFLVRQGGTIELANETARRLLADDPSRAREWLGEGHPGATTHRVAVAGMPEYTLVVAREPDHGLASRLARATTAWALTPRQADVLRWVAVGDPNKLVAEKLGCAEVTIELHVSALLRKARVDGRAALVAKLWTDPEAP
jgi:DNA-binding CsgD family transcriptional regulator/PAS domain-containing protein